MVLLPGIVFTYGLLIAWCTFAQAADCIFEPASIPLTWVKLPNKGAIRGDAISVGSPAQNISLIPVVETNNTYIFQPSQDCDTTEAACMTHRGGFFLSNQSTTYTNDTTQTPTNTNGDPTETLTSGSVEDDVFTIRGNVTLSELPLGVARSKVCFTLFGYFSSLSFGGRAFY
ncbi:hypothetical protein BDV96DRAFT_61332 [Lophiotrema nucula]|uniref:Peptidase A1 domain-containing protein n=1 Tax=Lophiotrema nucula TaxID=690887 RepID=A0A6A5ZC10_9PLEO|nr:hypothetical protein BDV96DRAFT_61332 [Lophiotrema nucula]